jgi:ATP-dependent Clp protease adapter protein ClpS
MTTDVDLDIKINDKIKINIDEPSRYKVVFLNDEQTPMDFVISLITELFR